MGTLFEDAAERFERQMRDILIFGDELDEEERHKEMDELMCKTLEEFGCHAGVKIFRDTKKWYA